MAARRLLGVTIFGWAAIAAIPLYIGAHLLLAIELARLGMPRALAIVATCGIASAIGMARVRARRSTSVRSMVRFGFVWCGTVWLCGAGIMLYRVVLLLGLPVPAFGLGLGTVLTAVAAYCARCPTVRRHVLKIDIARPIRLVVVSDLHLGDFYGTSWLSRIATRLRNLAPDAIVIAGDLLDGMSVDEAEMSAPWQSFDVPVLLVPGNHEGYSPLPDAPAQIEEAAGVTVLRDACLKLGDVTLVGLDEASDPQTRARLCSEAPLGPVVLVEHRPPRNLRTVPSNVTLMLSGHTHAGQIWPLGYLSSFEAPVWRGFGQLPGGVLYVLEGTGTWGPPFRLGSRSEIAVFDLVPGGESPHEAMPE